MPINPRDNTYRGAVTPNEQLPIGIVDDTSAYAKVEAAATLLGMEPTRIYQLVRMKRLPAIRTPVGILVPLAAIKQEQARREAKKAQRAAKNSKNKAE